MKDELKLSGNVKSNSNLKWQTETCICDEGDLCNFGIKLVKTNMNLLGCMTLITVLLSKFTY
jgi:hypothetical protein